MRLAASIFSLMLAWPAWAKAPETSLRPVARVQASSAPNQAAGTSMATATQLATTPALRPSARPEREAAEPVRSTASPRFAAIRPVARPDRSVSRRTALSEHDEDGAADAGNARIRKVAETKKRRGWLFRSLRPQQRTASAGKAAKAARIAREKGAVCGDPDIQGVPMGRITGQIGGCVIDRAVGVRSVGGVVLSQRSTMDCKTAKALKSWVESGMKPAIGNRGGGVARIKVAAHYACRRRNNASSGKLSEHGKGRAIDISGFTLRDGTKITMLKHWNSTSYRKVLRTMHRKACGPFGTVLGPNANRFHLDHFHLDTARYRSGPYCR